MRRREFITLLGGAMISPVAARAEHHPIPVIGVLSSRGASDAPQLLDAFRRGLKEGGFVEGQNVAFEYRFAENHNERLPALATDLVARGVTIIAPVPTPAALAAKAATTTIPIVFSTAGDPVQLGLVVSLNRPGGNLTGVTQLAATVAPKRLELLHELIPTARTLGLLVNPSNPGLADATAVGVQSAAQGFGLEIRVFKADADFQLEGLFGGLNQLRIGGLVIGGDPFFTARQEHLAELANRYAIPTVYEDHEFTQAGGLVSYGGSLVEAYRLTGVYAARILKGERPADLPVQQSTKVELYINLKTAKSLGITVPITLLGRADEVIE